VPSALGLAKGGSMPTSQRFPADIARSYRGIERSAAEIRHLLGFDPIEPLPGRECMRRLGRMRIVAGSKLLAVAYGVRKLGRGVEASTYYDPETERLAIDLSIETYRGLTGWPREDVRARFAFCHELGHAALHGAELIRFARLSRLELEVLRHSGSSEVTGSRDVEWQANAFSSSLLMPAAGLERLEAGGRLNEQEVCQRFHVSRSSAVIRAEVFRRRRQELLECLGQRGWGQVAGSRQDNLVEEQAGGSDPC
jgi:hypothetical protein